jgi:hypothetical protein
LSKDTPTKANYEIRIEGSLGKMWSAWFEGMSIQQETAPGDGQSITLIAGPVEDQPALHGLLSRIRDLNLTLVSVKRIEG